MYKYKHGHSNNLVDLTHSKKELWMLSRASYHASRDFFWASSSHTAIRCTHTHRETHRDTQRHTRLISTRREGAVTAAAADVRTNYSK